MNNIRKLLALLLALALLLPCAVFAESEAPEATEEPEVTEAPEDELPTDGEFAEEPTPPPVEELVDVDDLMRNKDLDDKGWWNILLLGYDRTHGRNVYGLTDTMIILSINPASSQVKMTSIMRDTWVKIYGKGEQKINAANVYGGPELAMRTVNECFGMNISEYVLVGMEAFLNIIDLVDGVTIPVLTEAEMKAVNRLMSEDVDFFIPEEVTELTEYGENVRLDSYQAVAYARIRKLDSDYERTRRQRDMLVAIAKELQYESIVTISGVVLELFNYVETNLTFDQIIKLAPIALSLDLSGIEQFRIPADGTFTSDTYDKVWQIRPNFEKNTQLLHDFIYGEGGTEE